MIENRRLPSGVNQVHYFLVIILALRENHRKSKCGRNDNLSWSCKKNVYLLLDEGIINGMVRRPRLEHIFPVIIIEQVRIDAVQILLGFGVFNLELILLVIVRFVATVTIRNGMMIFGRAETIFWRTFQDQKRRLMVTRR